MEPVWLSGNAKAGTVGGTLLVIILNISPAALFDTMLLAAVGALVSFSMSALLKYLVKRFTRK